MWRAQELPGVFIPVFGPTSTAALQWVAVRPVLAPVYLDHECYAFHILLGVGVPELYLEQFREHPGLKVVRKNDDSLQAEVIAIFGIFRHQYRFGASANPFNCHFLAAALNDSLDPVTIGAQSVGFRAIVHASFR